MKIIDTIPFFRKNYDNSVDSLRAYYREYPEVFREYFAYHCKDTEERHNNSILKYPQAFSTINQVYKNIIPIISEIICEYMKTYHVLYPIEVNLIIGGFGSNAYTHRQIIPNITFALEKLSPDREHLMVIVAHEVGHATHNILTNETICDWNNVQWDSPLIWLYQEGAAIHFSRKIVPGLHPSLYFSFNNNGYDWMEFCELNKQDIKNAFAKDMYSHDTHSLFREWFSINGGSRFGYSRLAYFLGDLLFQHLIYVKGEINAITAWKELSFIEEVEEWLFGY